MDATVKAMMDRWHQECLQALRAGTASRDTMRLLFVLAELDLLHSDIRDDRQVELLLRELVLREGLLEEKP